MIPGPIEFFDIIEGASIRLGWPRSPNQAAIERCRAEALRLDNDSGDPTVEAAALFFALCIDERRTWPVTHILPFVVVISHLFDHRLALHTDEPAELAWLRHAIAEGSTDWPNVRAWFIDHVRARLSAR